jgi:hypothetical protein
LLSLKSSGKVERESFSSQAKTILEENEIEIKERVRENIKYNYNLLSKILNFTVSVNK